MKVGVRCCFVVSRPPAKFHRVRNPFDAPTDNYSGSIAGLFVGCFRSPKIVVGPLSLLFSQLKPFCTATSSNRPLTCASETSPDPTQTVATVVSGSSPNIYKTSSFSYLGSLAYFSRPSSYDRRDGLALPKNPSAIYIKQVDLR